MMTAAVPPRNNRNFNVKHCRDGIRPVSLKGCQTIFHSTQGNNEHETTEITEGFDGQMW